MFVVHTSNCHGQNCTRRVIFRLGIDMLIANILVLSISYLSMTVHKVVSLVELIWVNVIVG